MLSDKQAIAVAVVGILIGLIAIMACAIDLSNDPDPAKANGVNQHGCGTCHVMIGDNVARGACPGKPNEDLR